ncbi:ABC transporter substrate-binding protein [Neorhizobium galegae]|uniref:ABC transporter substrate-binding protein n=1 Tax=Neorhizobium galegae TaxID=399 RepID=UPI00127FF2A0|nr:ABC transporter substrate-binding protein [Neorhizobium galegae]KAA9382983.1 ABC transporter substrate-binding protein [Neorhizobium galegae]MCM2498946.1 ABC transporter substrate-binding protein [Neorhizobium galegae]
MKNFPKVKLAISAVSLMMSMASVSAADLKIGVKSEPSSLDPQFHVLATNMQVAFAIFEPLVMMNEKLSAKPGLAESWRTVSDTVWEFSLRKDAKFSDGSALTADDVVFTFERVSKVPNSPTAFTLFTRQIVKVEAVDAHTVRIATKQSYPLLITDIANIPIMSKAAASGPAPEGKTTVELNRGEGLVGTGPFKFISWQKGADLVLERNPFYWGKAPEWDKVTYRPMTNAAARAAALLSGDIDVMEDPPTTDLEQFKSNPKLSVSQAPASRIVYIALDQHGEPSPGIKGTGDQNPLKDKRVREALSLSIDRSAIVDRVMGGVAVAAGDLVTPTMFGAVPARANAPAADAAKAKKLLAEAGYPNGFEITLGTPNGRYVNDVRVAQTIAAMWTRVGVKTEVAAAASPVFFKNRDTFQYSAYLAAWGNSTGEVATTLLAQVATRDPATGSGTGNGGRYSNKAVDQLLAQASQALDDKARSELLQKADDIVLADFGILPIHFEVPVWALRTGMTYAARADQYTLPQGVTSTK